MGLRRKESIDATLLNGSLASKLSPNRKMLLDVLRFAVETLIVIAVSGLLVLASNHLQLVPPSGYSVDDTYHMVLNEFAASPMRFGEDIGYTYGPLGFFAILDLHPWATPIRAISLSLFTAALVLTTYFRFVVPNVHALPARLLALVLFALFLDVSGVTFPVTLCFLPLPLLLADEATESRGAPWSRSAFAALLAIGALVKVSTLVAVIIGLTLIVIHRGLRDRRLALAPVVFVAVYLGVFLLSGQCLQDFAPFHTIALEMATGYSKENALFGGADEAFQVVLYFVLGGCFLRSAWILNRKKSLLTGAFSLLSLTLILFVAFKAGFTRYSPSHVTQTYFYLCTAGVGAACVSLSAGHHRFASCTAMLLAVLAASELSQRVAGEPYLWDRATTIPERVSRSLDSIADLSDEKGLRTSYQQALEKIWSTGPLADIDVHSIGSADVYPNEQGLVLAARMTYRPRPSMQSITANTTSLLLENKRHLEVAEHAPKTIFVRIDNPGELLPAFVDAPSWLSFLTYYNVATLHEPYVMLRRRAEPLNVRIIPVWRGTARFGETVTVPADEPMWAEIDVRPTLIGRIVETLYKIPPARIRIDRVSGDQSEFVFSRAAARAGFLLSPLIMSTQQFQRFAADPRSREFITNRLRGFAVESGFAGVLHEQTFFVNLYLIRRDDRGVAQDGTEPKSQQQILSDL